MTPCPCYNSDVSSLAGKTTVSLPPEARRDLHLGIAAGTVVGAVVLAQAWWLAAVIDRVFLGGADLAAVGGALALLVGLALARATLSWSADVLGQRAAARTKLALRGAAISAVTAAGPVAFARERTGEVVNTLASGVDALDAYVAQYVPQTRLAAIVPAMVLIAVLWADPLSALVLALTFPLIPLFMYLIGAAARDRTRQQWVTLSRTSARFLDALQGLPTLKAFGRAADETVTLADRAERFRRVTMDVLRLAFVSSLVLELLATLSTAIVAVEVGLRLMYARLAFHEALFVLILAPEFYRPLRALGTAYHAGMAGREAFARVATLADGAASVVALPEGRDAPAVPRFDRGTPIHVAFDEVGFAYSAERGPVLRGVSFVLAPGTTVALAGPGGSGKSTCAQLLLRFIDPAQGAILVNGRPLASLPPDLWRRHVAWVPQRPHLFHGSVGDNLRLARPEATDADVWEAIDGAAARRFVEALPRGLDTPIGERGAGLSGGQAQRLAIARALLADAPLVVLDEPTSQIDPWTEPGISAAIDRLRAGRTVLLIAHRVSMLRRADHIVLLAGGRVEAQGPPATLLASHGASQRLAGGFPADRSTS